MISSGIIFALLTTLSWSIGIFPFTQAARRLGSHELNHFRLLLACLIIGVVAATVDLKSFVGIFSKEYSEAWLWLAISGVVGLTIGDYFAFKMYSILGARIGSVLTTFSPAAALILGGLLISERISVIGIVGIFITIVGVNFISLGKREREKIPDHGHGSISLGIITGVLGALCQGAGLVLAKKGILSHEVSPLNATFMRLSAAVSSLYIFTLLKGNIREIMQPILSNRNNGIKYAIAGTLFGPCMGVCLSLYTVSRIDPSIAQTVFSLVPAGAFLLSVAFLKEKITWQSAVGLFVAIAGVIILIWRERLKELL